MSEATDDSTGQAELALRQAEWAEKNGLLDKAVADYRRVVQLQPDDARAHSRLARVLLQLNRAGEALTEAQKAHALAPHDPRVNRQLGQTLLHSQHPAQAIAHLRAALDADPGDYDLRQLLAGTLLELGRKDEAVSLFEHLEPAAQTDVEVLKVLGRFYRRANLAGSAERCYVRIIQLVPQQAIGYIELAQLYCDYTEFSRARDVALRGLAVQPGTASLWNTLAGSQLSIGLVDEAITSYRKALQLDPAMTLAYSNMLLVMHYSSATGVAELAEEHRRWGRRYAPPALAAKNFANSPHPERRIRIGYLSPDFRGHSVSFFIEPLFEHHDRAAFEVFAYGDVKAPDDVTQRLRGKVDKYRSVAGLSDTQLLELIRRDGIDVLVDLAGHAGSQRIAALAFKPAPVQVTYCGYPDTTGIEAVDYRITDVLADPPGAEERYTEELVRLPGCFLCYRAPPEAPAPGPPPMLTRGQVTFGSFNRECKVSQHCYDLWSRILQSVPGSRIVMKSVAGHDPATRALQLGEFQRRGIDPERVQLIGFIGDRRRHLGAYLDVDIALDTFPYHGTTTTLDSLLMGVPVITLAGQHHASRVGVSLLSNIGLPELIAHSDEEYVALAIRLATDPQWLAELHRMLRARLFASPLCDGPAFTRKFEAALRAMWQRWCRVAGGAAPTA